MNTENVESQNLESRLIDESADIKGQLHVQRIRVDNLFGEYSYDLEKPNVDVSKLLILYGSNGSGKTTLLNLTYHILSCAKKAGGHRTAIAHASFRQFTVLLSDGTKLSALREADELLGTFSLILELPSGALFRKTYVANKDLIVKQSDGDNDSDEAFRERIAALGISVKLLPENRKDLPENDGEAPYDHSGPLQFQLKGTSRKKLALENAAQKLLAWVRFEAVRASNIGDRNVNTIYAEIVKQLAAPPSSDGAKSLLAFSTIVELFKTENARSQRFARFALTPALGMDELNVALEAIADRSKRSETLSAVLVPYLESTRARLDTLQFLNDSLSAFVDNVNSFFTDKKVNFDLRNGLKVFSRNNREIKLSMLSSGEQQLLLLMCEVVASGRSSSIFIIDEPELSLNVKWQQRLIDALVGITEGRPVQFIVATHSMELLAKHRRNLVRLVDDEAFA